MLVVLGRDAQIQPLSGKETNVRRDENESVCIDYVFRGEPINP